MSLPTRTVCIISRSLRQAGCFHGVLATPEVRTGSRDFSTSGNTHQESSYKLVVVGGGTGGSAIAHKFASKLGRGNVAVIEPSEVHFYQPMFTLVGAGLKQFKQTHSPMGEVLPKDADWIKEKAASFDPDGRTLTLESGKQISYEYLVLGMGLELNYGKVKGLPEALEQDPRVCSNYSPQYVKKTLPAIENFQEGSAVFTFPTGPIKCAGAPQKICYLLEDLTHRNGKRPNAHFVYNTALPVIFGIPRYAQSLLEIVKKRDIEVNFKHNLIEVHHEKSEAVFEILESDGETKTFKYDFLHASPPCSPPAALQGTPLVDGSGFVEVDIATLQHKKYKNVFAIGDCANLPTAKTAAAIAGQSGVVGRNLTCLMNGKDLPRTYDGYTSCPLVITHNTCILAEFGYDGKIMETFPIDQSKPRWSMFHMKADLMPWIYWHMLIKGIWHGPKLFRKIFSFGMKE